MPFNFCTVLRILCYLAFVPFKILELSVKCVTGFYAVAMCYFTCVPFGLCVIRTHALCYLALATGGCICSASVLYALFSSNISSIIILASFN